MGTKSPFWQYVLETGKATVMTATHLNNLILTLSGIEVLYHLD